MRFLLPSIGLLLSLSAGAQAGTFGIQEVTPALEQPILTMSQCGAVQPLVLQVDASTRVEGSFATCRVDADCEDGAYCRFDDRDGVCEARGLTRRPGVTRDGLDRGDIYYVVGDSIDVGVTILPCTRIADVRANGLSLRGDAIEQQPDGFRVISRAPSASFPGNDRVVVRVDVAAFADGRTTGLEIDVVPDNGTGRAIARLEVVSVAAIDGTMTATISETLLRNQLIVAMYRTFGDRDELWALNEDDVYKRMAKNLDWDTLGFSSGQYNGTDIRLFDDMIAFSTEFDGEGLVCDPRVHIDGVMTLVPDADAVNIAWLDGPNARLSSGLCSLFTLGIYEVITQLVTIGIRDDIEEIVRLQVAGSVAGNGEGRVQICVGCEVQEVSIGPGGLHIEVRPPIERVRITVPATSTPDRTLNPFGGGMAIPSGSYVAVMPSGLYQACPYQYADIATCNAIQLDAMGTFNWWGSDIPVPSPWESQSGAAAYYRMRHAAWGRLFGLQRQPQDLVVGAFPVGALLARRGDHTWSVGPRQLAAGGCVLAPRTDRPADRLAFTLNEALTYDGTPPSAGSFDLTIFVPEDAAQSEALFAGAGARPCVSGP